MEQYHSVAWNYRLVFNIVIFILDQSTIVPNFLATDAINWMRPTYRDIIIVGVCRIKFKIQTSKIETTRECEIINLHLVQYKSMLINI